MLQSLHNGAVLTEPPPSPCPCPQVKEVTDTDVICVAQNSAVLEGLLCVFHAERSTGGELQNKQVGRGRGDEEQGEVALTGQQGIARGVNELSCTLCVDFTFQH